MKFKRFTKAGFLKQVGRPVLAQLFGQFKEQLEAKGVSLPPAELEDADYLGALSGMAMAPDGLPDNLIETLFAIEEMSNPAGQERLEEAAALAGLDLKFDEKSSHGDIAIQVFLARPDLLAAKHNEQEMIRLTAFEYFGSRQPVDRSDSFAAPDQTTLNLLASDLDAWFTAHNRGVNTTHVEVYVIDGEFWFLVRHGDTFTRTAKVENQKTEMLHFRPAKDDVVVYTPERDEIRVHAGTKGEREVYRKAFGRRLHQDYDFFSQRKAYTLEPLRTDGADVLDAGRLNKVTRIVLRQIEVVQPGDTSEVITFRLDDLIKSAAERRRALVDPHARVLRAAFDFYFAGEKKARKVHIRPPNLVRLGRHCDAATVHQWMSVSGIRGSIATKNGKEANHVAHVAIA